MGETRVDLLHLLEDLRDAYPGALEETILTEIVANALDSGARTIRLGTNAAESTLTVLDDGAGMLRRELAKYHDIAASSKTRGQGIGFAGVGIKLGLLLSREVVTETRRGKVHVATLWHLASRHKAPWKWIPPPGIVSERGTAVTLQLSNALSLLVDAGFVETVLRRHFEPFFEPAFESMLAAHYKSPIRFELNGRALGPETDSSGNAKHTAHMAHPALAAGASRGGEIVPIEVRMARKRKPSASGYLLRESGPLPEDRRGVAISTLGKVIRRGWDWLGVTPATPERIGGLIEVPALSECLTLNKADFIRTGTRGATYLAYRKAIQEVISRELAAWGDAADTRSDANRRAARPIERDLERVLLDLADEFPLLSTLVERREGGQRKLPIGRGAADGRTLVLHSLVSHSQVSHSLAFSKEGDGESTSNPEPGAVQEAAGSPSQEQAAPDAPGTGPHPEVRETPPPAPASPNGPTMTGANGPKRPGRYGLIVQFESREGSPELGRLVESTIWINEAHPAFQRAALSRSEGYHIALSVAMALASLAVEPAGERAFIMSFLEHWGSARGEVRPARRR